VTIIRVPASTSNLGPGFDAHGLALNLYLTVEVEPAANPSGSITFEGEGADELQSAPEQNLILRAMKRVAEREGIDPRPALLKVKNEIPLARGLGSSGAAIVAGISLFEALSGTRLPIEKRLAYATEIEGHSDNVSAALLGSFVTSCVTDSGDVLATRIEWPPELAVIVAIPDFKLRTEDARRVIPETISHKDAVFNIQRASLLVGALVNRRFDLVKEAMRDRLHQPYRAALVPGLEDALKLPDKLDLPGLLGVALSGSGPSVTALALDDIDQISAAISACFHARGIDCKSRVLDVESGGRVVRRLRGLNERE